MATENKLLRSDIYDLVNSEIQRRHDRGITKVSALLPTADGSIVMAKDATAEQWQYAIDLLSESTIDEIEKLVDTLALLNVSYSVLFLSKQESMENRP